MKGLNKERKRIVIYCEQVLKDAEREAEKESISLIQAFESKKKHVYRKIDSIYDAKRRDEKGIKDLTIGGRMNTKKPEHVLTPEELDNEEGQLKKNIENLEDDLMSVEMKL